MSDLFRAEMVGLGTFCIMALVAHAVYSLTYGIIFAGRSVRFVPILEMWMCYTHLIAGGLCAAMQATASGILGFSQGLPYVSDALSALCMGVALIVTCISSACLSGGIECSIYYPSAVFQSAAAVTALVWSWVMYLTAMGCRPGGDGGGIGIGRCGGFTVAAVMASVQPQAVNALLTLCLGIGARWDATLQTGGLGVTVDAALLFSSVALPGLVRSVFPQSNAALVVALGLSSVMCAVNAGVVHVGAGMDNAAARVCMGVAAVLPWASLVQNVVRGDADARTAPDTSSAGLLRRHPMLKRPREHVH